MAPPVAATADKMATPRYRATGLGLPVTCTGAAANQSSFVNITATCEDFACACPTT
jgi:hypothetical protein